MTRWLVVVAALCLATMGCGKPQPASDGDRHADAMAELAASKDEKDRFYALSDAAASSFEIGSESEARRYATELLALSGKFRRNWNYGNAIHDGNVVLGRLAAKAGDVELASKHLIEAGKTPGSPQLDSFGPNMSLAQDLLVLGETEAVLEYLALCRAFWELHEGRLDEWSARIKAGERPSFGANMYY